MKNPEDISPGKIILSEGQILKKKRPPARLALFLFSLTALTTTIAGYSLHSVYLFQGGELASLPHWTALIHNPALLIQGIPFSLGLMLILLFHESGHYFACRHYRIDCTLPYLIPAPSFLNMFGTFGALIRIKSPFFNRRQLFDVGIAGPLAGFVISLPVLAAGIILSSQTVISEPESGYILLFGEPLLFKITSYLFYSGEAGLINLHPLGWAAWIGMLATSLNLLPAGQLDGGHIVYALFGPVIHKYSSAITTALLLGLGLWSWPVLAYLLFGILLLVMKLKHPPTLVDSFPLDRKRQRLGLAAGIIFLLTFIPFPVQISGTL